MVLPVVLGTRSSGRRAIADSVGLQYTFTESPYDDPPGAPDDCDTVAAVSVLAMARAMNKAIALVPMYSSPTIIITADTMCADAVAILGKPASVDEASVVIRRLIGGKQTVVTAVVVAVACASPPSLSIKLASVYAADVICGTTPSIPDKTMDALCDEYLAAGYWKGCSGSIAVEEMTKIGFPLSFGAVELPQPHASALVLSAADIANGVQPSSLPDCLSFERGLCHGAGVHAVRYGIPLETKLRDSLGSAPALPVILSSAHANVDVHFTPIPQAIIHRFVAPLDDEGAVASDVQKFLMEVVVGIPMSMTMPLIAAVQAEAASMALC